MSDKSTNYNSFMSSTAIIKDSSISTTESLNTDDIFKCMDLYFNRRYIMYSHMYNSFNKFIDDDIRNFLKENDNTFYEKITKDQVIKYMFEFDNIVLRPPMMEGSDRLMFPSDARNGNFTYASRLEARVTQIQEIRDIYTKEIVSRKVIGEPEDRVPIANIPILVRSKYCSTNLKKNFDNTECEYDPGCYFIVNGYEKVVISQERMIDNKPLVFKKKGPGTVSHYVQVNSRSPKVNGIMQIIRIQLNNNGSLTLMVPILNEFPIVVLFRALGIKSDSDIIDYIVPDKKDQDMLDMVKKAIRITVDDKGAPIQDQNNAINYLTTKIRVPSKYKYSETDKDVRQKQKRKYLESLLVNNFLPHITGGSSAKVYYLGYMINKLLNCALGRHKPDDRDSYTNKRVDLVGPLLDMLFRQFFKKMINECNKYWKKRTNNNDEKPFNIINQIRPNTIEQGLKAALSTGAWGGGKKGVAQVLQRLTYLQAIEFYRRIDSPSNDASCSKLTSPRQVHPTQLGFMCCVVGDTEVLLSDGMTRKKIKDFTNADTITTINPETLEEEISQVHSFFKKEPEKVLKITTMTGRILKCTHDHQVLVNTSENNIWVRADQLKIDDKIIIKHVQDMQPIEKPMNVIIKYDDVDEQYRLELLELCLIDKQLSQIKLEIIARLLGACVTDGNIGVRKNEKYYTCTFCVGEESDAFQILNDIVKLGFGAPNIRQRRTIHQNVKNGKETVYNTFNVDKNGAFAYYMALMGGFVGKKTMMCRKLPEWLLNANSRVKQEFLSGFQGGDGCRMSHWKEKTAWKIRMSPSVQTTSAEFKDDIIEYMKSISNMFTEFGIKNNVTINPIENQFKVSINFDQAIRNLENYCNIIGYRYCADKRRGSAPVIEYLKYKRYLEEQKEQDYTKIIELCKLDKKPKQIVDETGFKYEIVKRIIENYRKGFTPNASCVGIIGYDDFIRKYHITDDKMTNAILKIEEIENEPVYDFTTVSNNHSFIANGIVVHNCAETPEHAKVGLVKHLSLLGSITVATQSQVPLIKKLLDKRVTKLSDVHPTQVGTYTRVFINGDFYGVCDKPIILYTELKNAKYSNSIEATVGIIYDDMANEIRVYSDGGRLFRPVIRVMDNVPMLTKDHIAMISPNKTKSETMVTSWDEFMQRFLGVVEYIDAEEQCFSMLATNVDDVYAMRNQMFASASLAKTRKEVSMTNRYGDMTFVKYSHCDFHPSLLLGLIVTNIPFSNHNQGPRNIFQYAQGRQAMCIYISNYRFRMDTSFILYHPHRPLVNTRTSKYMYNDILSPGENAVVAIASYTGYNQEDAAIFNQAAIDRGLFRSTSYEKYISILQKNQSTSQDELFMKPDPSKVAGMRYGSYEKLNERGFVPEETRIEHGDILIGKVSPIQATEGSSKVFKDNSETYKSQVPGVVDRVYSDIYNIEGYEMKKIKTRSERIPTVGDKVCCYSPDHDVLTTDGWIPIDKITREHKIACLIDGTKLEYHNPTEVQTYDYDGDMYVVDSLQVQLKVTPNHRMYVRQRKSDTYKIETAEQIHNKRRCYIRNVMNYSPNTIDIPAEFILAENTITHFIVPKLRKFEKLTLPINEWLTFFGIWIAEGCCSDTVVEIAANKQRVKDAYEICCEKMGFKIHKKHCNTDNEGETNAWRICSTQLATYMKQFSVGATNKYLPDWVWYLNREQCIVLINSMILGDGHTVRNHTKYYSTSSKKLADDFQRLCLHAGYAANINIKYKKGHENIFYRNGVKKILTCSTDAYIITLNNLNMPLVNSKKKDDGTYYDRYEKYTGTVHCCTVPNDGVIYVRRNGYPVWCGNSRHGQL